MARRLALRTDHRLNGEIMKQRKIVNAVVALAVIGMVGAATAATAATAAPAAASDNKNTAAAASAGPVASWGPYSSAKSIKDAHVKCDKMGQAGLKAKKWKAYICKTEDAKAGKYVRLYAT
ncbi:hypothetical protein ACFT9I_02230 [Streptomyces sp. NPDC057137]|uniref:hypothetical protein n=1 Tax=Streptomyces sp. NPDC057137 TaxID=3346030 RepID=UPI0036396C71